MPNPLQRLFVWVARLSHTDDPQIPPTDAAATLEAAQQATTEGDYTRAAALYQRAYRMDPTALTVDDRPHDAVRLADRHALYVKIKRLSTAEHPVNLQTAWDQWCDFRQRFGTTYDPDDLATVMAAVAAEHGFKDKYQSAYSGGAQAALRTARGVALGVAAGSVQPEHLLLGLLLAPDNHAKRALQAAGLDVETVMNALGVSSQEVPENRAFADMDPAFVVVLGAARAIADKQQEPVVDTQHLLLALLDADAPEVTQLLADVDTPPDDIRARLLASG